MRQPPPTIFSLLGILFLLAVLAPVPQSAAQAASLVVTTLDDELNSDGDCSLREAITASNTNAAVDACPAGSATTSDTITFTVSGTIVLGSMLPNITDPAGLTIDGGQTVTISGNNAVKVMRINKCATLDLKNITIADGYSSTCCGGGIENYGLLTVTNSTFSGNDRALVNSFGTAHIVNSTFSNNFEGYSGGSAIRNDRGTVTIARSTFTANKGGKYGAIWIGWGSTTITDSTFSGNWAARGDTSVGGGAIYSEGQTTVLAVTNSTFANNGAAGHYGAGGGAISVNSGTVTVTNSTFSGNRAYAYDVFSSGWGGAIYTQGTGGVDITNSTFLDNYALEEGSSGTKGDAGDAIRNNSAGMTLTLRNTLVARYIPEQETRRGWPLALLLNCSGPIINGGGNLNFNKENSADTTCPDLNGLNDDPLLDPAGLQDNGGPTDTIALLAGSPAIAAAVDATCTAAPVNSLDQRGAPRVSCDIGAFEYASTPPPVSPPGPLPPLPPQSGCPVFNRPPVVTNPGNQTSAEGDTVSLQIVASDPNGDTLTYSATGLPDGLNINATTGLISGILSYNSAGIYVVTVTVSDGVLSDSETFTWTVNSKEDDADGDGLTEDQGDCDDTNRNINPDALELCNGVDDNCNGTVDDGFAGLGSPCTVGIGECQRSGTTMCTDDGSGTQCSATPGPQALRSATASMITVTGWWMTT